MSICIARGSVKRWHL